MIRVNYEIFFLGVSGVSVAEFKTVHQKLHARVKRAFSLFTVRRDRAVTPLLSDVV